MILLLAAAALFLGIHLLVSGTRLRDVITAQIGEKAYTGLFALASLGALVWLCRTFNSADIAPSNTVLFDAGQSFRTLGILVTLAAFALVVPGVTRGNPSSAGQEKAPVNGVLRITRHPFLWGVMLWSSYHLIATGTFAAILAGKNRFVAREYCDWRLGLALLLFAAFLWFHSSIFGVPAFPPTWLAR
ncbi:MAG: NnrU family protein [Rhizomicrobium sp.]|nr:NnrU family protein [Rhizomicrobium sp.]